MNDKASIVREIGQGNPWAMEIVTELLKRNELDVIDRLYRFGPRGSLLHDHLVHDCFNEIDLLIVGVRIKIEVTR